MPSIMLDTLSMSQIIEKISFVYKEIEPEIIYIPFSHDVHTDHQIISKAFNQHPNGSQPPMLIKF